jgi:SAM-dependent methyltransferase
MSLEVVGFYDRHPINEGQILASLEKRGTVLDAIEPDDLFEFDQDHYGGVAAVEALAERAGIGSESVVLDLCAGLGGPARYLAWRFGCRVAGVDITASRVASARRLTELVGLGDLVEFIEADATKLPLPSRSYTACISQEAFVHIVDKERLFAECHRVLDLAGRLPSPIGQRANVSSPRNGSGCARPSPLRGSRPLTATGARFVTAASARSRWTTSPPSG